MALQINPDSSRCLRLVTLSRLSGRLVFFESELSRHFQSLRADLSSSLRIAEAGFSRFDVAECSVQPHVVVVGDHRFDVGARLHVVTQYLSLVSSRTVPLSVLQRGRQLGRSSCRTAEPSMRRW